MRLTGSGLGCPDWPTCEQDSLLAPLEYHALVEFGNRLFTGVVATAVIAAVLGSWRRRPRRSDLVIWSCGLVVGVVGQVLLGALLVSAELDPRFVMGHFLLSMVLLWNAAVLDVKARMPDADITRTSITRTSAADISSSDGALAELVGSDSDSGLKDDRWTRMLMRAVFIVGAALLVTGALVTGSGPHAGDTRAERLPLLVREVARIHSIVAIGLLALVVVTWMRMRQQPTRSGSRLSWLTAGSVRERQLLCVAVLLVVQGAIGYAQYFSGVPALLVGIHVAMASAIWIGIVKAACSATQPRKPENAIGHVHSDSVHSDSADDATNRSGATVVATLAART